MPNEKHVDILETGTKTWNLWRMKNVDVRPELTDAELIGANLTEADLSDANLDGANLANADLSRVNLSRADLSRVNLSNANLSGADLSRTELRLSHLIHADLSRANLNGANLSYANLTYANLTGANLSDANLNSTLLRHADLSEATIGWTTFGNNDLSVVTGLDSVIHEGPSSIGVDTLYRSAGNIPELFLRHCGLPDDFIKFVPYELEQAIQFFSCFISYSRKDEEFARRLYSRMRDEKLRVWFAPEDIKGGQKLYDQIQRAIQLHDRLLLVLSASSMRSQWVMTELRNARREEIKQDRRKLFPMGLVNFETIQAWECFDSDIGKDLAVEVREYFIPDFSNWKDHDSFEASFKRLLRDLRSEES